MNKKFLWPQPQRKCKHEDISIHMIWLKTIIHLTMSITTKTSSHGQLQIDRQNILFLEHIPNFVIQVFIQVFILLRYLRRYLHSILSILLCFQEGCMRVLLSFGADLNSQDSKGHTPLHFLVSKSTSFNLYVDLKTKTRPSGKISYNNRHW